MKTTIFRVVPLALLLFAARPAAAGTAVAAYEVKARTESWMPIRMEDVAAGIADQVVAVLGQGDLLRLVKIKPRSAGDHPPLAKADFKLSVFGEVVEQAGNFTVTLTLRPVRDPARPSFVTAATASISGRPKRQMFNLITGAARQAATRLRSAVRSRSRRLDGQGGDAVMPADIFQWGKLVPTIKRPKNKDLATVLNGRLSWNKRKDAFLRVAGLAYDDATTRRVLAKVALTDPDKLARLYAVRFLGPSSRSYSYIQRVVLAVLREDADPKVKREAMRLSLHFPGLTPQPTYQTWVQLLASKVSELDNRAFSGLVEQLAHHPRVPNLDLGLVACLTQQEVLREGRERKRSCLKLVAKLPAARRNAVLEEYLNRPLDEFGDDLPNTYKSGPLGRAVETALSGPCPAPTIRKVVWRLLSEQPNGRTAQVLLSAMAKHQYTAEIINKSAETLPSIDDHRSRGDMKQVLKNVVRRFKPDWNVLAWEAAEQTLRQLVEEGDDRAKRDYGYILRKLGKMRAQKHRAGLKPHLRADDAPRASAVDYFAGCVLRSTGPKVRSECVDGLKWLALSFPERRRRAVATLYGLLRQTRAALDDRTRRRLESAISAIGRAYKNHGTSRRSDLCLMH